MGLSSWILLLLSAVFVVGNELEVDENGYILYCPCMGRFGNQADHFLGALSFAHGLNRTIVLPPWVEYKPGHRNSVQVPFKTYFSVEAINEYHRAITMEDFMKELAPKLWPVGKRTVYCYMARRGGEEGTCNAKDGNPFGPFWDTFDIDFDNSEFYGPLSYDTHNARVKSDWENKFPVREHPILAFTGAPASFPVREVDVPLQQYVRWSDEYDQKSEAYIAKNLKRPFIGIHMRNGVDFEKACDHVESSGRNLFASAQCLGFKNEYGKLSDELCFPKEKTVIAQLKKAVKKYKAESVFIATDNDPMIDRFKKVMKKVNFVTLNTGDRHGPADPHMDLAILTKADHYICNCVSTFSAFATRARRVDNKSVDFWAFTPKKHDEL